MLVKIPQRIMSCKISRQVINEFFRFGVVGVAATGIHYTVYCLLQQIINAGVAYTVGYAVSFAANFALTSLFTFKTRATVARGVGFGLAHLCNYLFQMLLLHAALRMGLSRVFAPVPVYCIAIPVNFLMVRFAFRHFEKNRDNLPH